MPALSHSALVSGWLDGSAANTVEATTKALPNAKIEAITFTASLLKVFFEERDVTMVVFIPPVPRQAGRKALVPLPKYLFDPSPPRSEIRESCPYFVFLRLYGPLEPWFNKTWKPGVLRNSTEASLPASGTKQTCSMR